MLTALGVMFAAVGVGAGGYVYYLSESPAPTPAASLKTAPPPVAEAAQGTGGCSRGVAEHPAATRGRSAQGTRGAEGAEAAPSP